MGIFSRTTKLIIPIKNCLSFAEDKIFERARQTLQAAGIKLSDIIEDEAKELSSGQLILPTMDSVFFHADRFEVMIDARGFRPEDLKCTISPNVVEVIAQRQDNIPPGTSNRNMSLTRTYQLPQRVKPEEGNCCLSSEGILLITAPWLK